MAYLSYIFNLSYILSFCVLDNFSSPKTLVGISYFLLNLMIREIARRWHGDVLSRELMHLPLVGFIVGHTILVQLPGDDQFLIHLLQKWMKKEDQFLLWVRDFMSATTSLGLFSSFPQQNQIVVPVKTA